MINHRKLEMPILVSGGVLLLLHGVKSVVLAIEYFASFAPHALASSATSFGAAETAGYAAGAAVGHVFWPIFSLCVGAGLLWLAACKRSRRAGVSQSA